MSTESKHLFSLLIFCLTFIDDFDDVIPELDEIKITNEDSFTYKLFDKWKDIPRKYETVVSSPFWFLFSFSQDVNYKIDSWNDNNEKYDEIPSNIIILNEWDFLNNYLTTLTLPSTLKKCPNWNNCLRPKYFENLLELKCYKHHVINTHLIDYYTDLTKIKVIN